MAAKRTIETADVYRYRYVGDTPDAIFPDLTGLGVGALNRGDEFELPVRLESLGVHTHEGYDSEGTPVVAEHPSFRLLAAPDGQTVPQPPETPEAPQEPVRTGSGDRSES